MGITNGACCKWVKAIPELLWPVPKYWTLEEAATVPLPYAQAFYCLVSIDFQNVRYINKIKSKLLYCRLLGSMGY